MCTNKMYLFAAYLLTCLYLVQGKPWEPVPRQEQWWVDRHNAFVENSRVNGANISIVFTGSSSIENWGSTGQSIWNAKYAPLGAVNYGIGGDSIEHCLWRNQNQELENLNPKLLVLYCGSNNIPGNPVAPEISRGVIETLNDLRVRLPNTKILYLQINPRGDTSTIEEIWGRITIVNAQVGALHDGDKITVFSMFDDLISSWGQIKEELYAGDKLHLNYDGYVLWDRLWNQTFFDLLG